MRVRVALAAAVSVAFVCVAAPAEAGATYEVSQFGPVPSPGHPFGVLATKSGVYVTTSSGDPFMPSTGDDAIFRYAASGGKPIDVTHVKTSPTMGLYTAAEDSAGRLYVVDMNGRILRYTPSANGLTHREVYATNPYAALGWPVSMWECLAFDSKGNLYVTDEQLGAIWKIPPNRKPALWLQDPRLLPVPLTGVNDIAIGPDGKLYFVQPIPADRAGGATVYRLPLTSSTPSSAQLEVFHEFPVAPAGGRTPIPAADDLAFGRSGKLYVTLTLSDQVAVLSADGKHEVATISSDAFDSPLGVRFEGDSILVANSNYAERIPPSDPANMRILKVDVGEPGLPLIRPAIR